MSKSVADFDFFDPETIECPFTFYKALRDQAPVYQLPETNIFMVSKHGDIRRALKDTELFSSDFKHLLQGPEPTPAAAKIYEDGYEQVDTLLTMDPPRHRVYRNLINKVFSAKRVEKMHGYIEQIADELIDSFIDKGECEFIKDFATPLPVYVIADQLGVPRSGLDSFKSWSDAFASRLGGMVTAEEEIANAQLIVEYQLYMADVIEQRRKQPQDDMISDLANTQIDDGRLMTMEELLSMVQQLLVAGNETTTSSIAEGLLNLIQLPMQMKAVLEDMSTMGNAVEEMLRLSSPTAGIWRVVTRDTEIDGVAIAKDSLLMLRYASGNRDEEVFDDAENMDVCRRNAKDHIAFGQGVHFCPGAMLGRKEMNVAFSKILQRLTNITLAKDKNDLTHWPNVVLRGLKELHITFDKK
jgi:cytochrome P450